MDCEIINYTVDVYIRVYGRSLNEFFEDAAHALTVFIMDREKINPSQPLKLRLMEEA